MGRRIASIGECMIELSAAPELGPDVMRRAFAGDTLNTAVYLARCLRRQPGGDDWSVAYATRLGDDGLSTEMLAQWQAEGLDTSLVRRDGKALPGLYLIETDSAGERQFSYWRENAPARRLFTGPGEAELRLALARFDALYFSGITLAILPVEGRERLLALAHDLRRRGGLVAFDGNHRSRLWLDAAEASRWLGAAYAAADIALPGADELALFDAATADSLADLLLGRGAGEVAVKRGSGACLVASAAGRVAISPPPAMAVDTTAAGDSFNAAYLAARLTGAPPEAAARLGHHLAVQVIGRRGAILPEGGLDLASWQDLVAPPG